MYGLGKRKRRTPAGIYLPKHLYDMLFEVFAVSFETYYICCLLSIGVTGEEKAGIHGAGEVMFCLGFVT